MKNLKEILGILLFLLLAGYGNLNAQRGMRGMQPQMNNMRMRGMENRRDSMMRGEMRQRPDSLQMRGMEPRSRMNQNVRRGMYGMRPNYMPGMRYMRPGQNYYNWRAPGYNGRMYGNGWGRMPMNHMGPMGREGMRPGRGNGWSFESLPNITEKQKEDINQIRKRQQEEMKKLRDEMSEKMNNMRESHRKAIMNQLNDEQKKVFESRSGRVASPPVPASEKKK